MVKFQTCKRLTPGFWLPKGSPERIRLEARNRLTLKAVVFVSILGFVLGLAKYPH